MIRGFALELKHTLRMLRQSPGFTTVAVLSLAIGIGANVAIFGAVRAMLLDSLPLPAAEQLVHVGWSEPAVRVPGGQIGSTSYRDPASGASFRSNFSYPQYQAIAAASGGRLAITAYAFLREIAVAIDGRPPLVAGGLLADGDYFATLGLSIAHGRALSPADDRPGAPAVAVITHRFWTSAFGADPSAIGSTIRINGTPVEIVGVSEAGFRGLSRGGFFNETDVTVPLSMQPLVAAQFSRTGRSMFTADDVFWLRLLGRLQTPTASAQVEQAMTREFRLTLPQAVRESPEPPIVRLLPGARGEPTAPTGERPLMILMGVVAIVLLIACLNVAGLMLARGVARQREIAVRRALGASRQRVLRELLLESSVLAVAGAASGLLLALWGRQLLSAMLTSGIGSGAYGSTRIEMPLDWMVIASAIGIAAIVALLCGLLPAVRLSRVEASSMLKQRGAGSMPTLHVGRALIVLQIATSIPLTVGALVFLRTLGNLAGVELGFDPRGVAFFRVNPAYASATPATEAQLYLDLLQRVEAVPGVTSATLIENPLMSGLSSSNSMIVGGQQHGILMNAVGPRFFETMGMRIIAGRAPDANDRAGRQAVAVVNEAAVAQLFRGRSPVGDVVRVPPRDIEIIGVVSDSRYSSPRTAVRPVLYDAALQRPGFGGHHVVLRTSGSAAAIEPDVRRAVAAVHSGLPVTELRTQLAQIEQATARERIFSELLTLFGGFALLLAGIGLHGVTSYAVARRTNEIGVRVAVGATPGHVVLLVLRQVAILAAAGLIFGIPATAALGPLVQSQLFDVLPTDVFLISCAGAATLSVAAVAAALPALRAATLNVVEAMRSE